MNCSCQHVLMTLGGWHAQPCKNAALLLFIQGSQTEPMYSIYETKLPLESLDSRYIGTEGFAFLAQAAENKQHLLQCWISTCTVLCKIKIGGFCK